MKEHIGTMASSKAPTKVRRAYQCWTDQVSRCYRPATRAYRFYGARGIKVCYSAPQFVSWYLKALEKFSGKTPSIDRINHRKHYCFCNIRLAEHKENAVEGLTRSKIRSHLWRAINIVDFKTGRVIETVPHAGIAAKKTGVLRSNVALHCIKKGTLGKQLGFTFRYAEPSKRT